MLTSTKQYQTTVKPLLSVLFILMLFQNSPLLLAAQKKLIRHQPDAVTETSNNMSKAEVIRSVKDTLKLLNEVYIYPDKAQQISQKIERKLERGDYDQINNKLDFAQIISNDLRKLSGDGHLSLQIAKDSNQKPTHILQPKVGKQKNNYAFERVEVLEGNIGYLKFNKFNHLEEAKKVASSALYFLQTTDALIIDLRDNIGGSPKMVQHILSHFYQGKSKLWEMVDRNGEVVNRTETNPELSVKRFSNDFPIYILTSSTTYSAAEFFTYSLINSGKAKVIGENSGGGAHMVESKKINDSFHGRFSVQRPLNPVTNTDWEGVGIKPDIEVSQELALDTAYIQALQQQTIKHPNNSAFYQWNIDIVKQRVAPLEVSEEILKSYTGLFGKERVLSYSNGDLYYNKKGNKKVKLLPLTEDLFMLSNISYFRIKIMKDKNKVIAVKGIYDDGELIEYLKSS